MEWRTISLIEMSYCDIFASRVAVPVPLPALNPCRASYNWMEDNIRILMMPDISFHRTSTRPIPMKLVLPPLGIITTICQAHDAASSPPLKVNCMMTTNLYQFPRSGSSSWVFARSHILRCSALMTDRPPERCSCSRSTESEIIPSPGILSSTGKGSTSMGISQPGGRTW